MSKNSVDQHSIKKKIKDSLSILLFLVLWEFIPHSGLPHADIFVIPPSGVIQKFIEMIQDGKIYEHVILSLLRTLTGFGIAVLVGIPLGFLLGGWFKTIERILYPVLRFLSSFNPFSLFPVFILFFGIGEVSKVVMIFWFSIWPLVFNTVTGVKELDPLLVKSSRSMGASQFVLFTKVVFPSALPYIFTGLKASCGAAFFMLIAAEMIGASSGLGWLIINSQVNMEYNVLYTTTVIIALFGLVFNNIFKVVEKRVVKWKTTSALEG